MNIVRELRQCYNPRVNFLWQKPLTVSYILLLICSVNAKYLDIKEQQNISNNSNDIKQSCESVHNFFHSLNMTVDSSTSASIGSICGGSCCSTSIENELLTKSTYNFERLLRHHTRSLRSNLMSTAKIFRDHVLELTHHSENKTLYLFSQVYRRMAPLSQKPIHELYTEIRNHISGDDDTDFDTIARQFFMELFPVAYHHAVHSGSDASNDDFHDDYKNCLMHTYDDLQPFGSVPKILAKSLKQSIGSATVFTTALDRAAVILANTEEIDSDYLTQKCQHHLMKMGFCSKCNGLNVKSCYGYCTNVMRGCLAQYVGILDSPWSSVAESIESLWHNTIKMDLGIEEVIKNLDGKLSEAIMYAMENGPLLEKKVKKSCGTPTLLPIEKEPYDGNDIKPTIPSQNNNKWVSPPNTEMLRFLVNIDKSKDFYSKIVDSVCEDEDYNRDDQHCWTGDRFGDYKQPVMSIGVDAQKYNPEVPLEPNAYTKTNKLNELIDKLIKLRNTIANAMTIYSSHGYSDIQGDMARHDEEGSGAYRDDLDDDEYNNIASSGDGSGDGSTSSSVPRFNNNFTELPSSGGDSFNRISSTIVSTILITIIAIIFTT